MTDLPPPSPAPEPPVPPPVSAPTPPEVPLSPPEVPTSIPNSAEPGSPLQPRNQDEKTLGILLHALPALGILIGTSTLFSLPILAAVLPLGFWLWKRDSSPYLKAHGQEVVQFAATFSIPTQLLLLIPGLNCLVYPFIVAACILTAILSIVGAVKTSNGDTYRYPYTIRFLE